MEPAVKTGIRTSYTDPSIDVRSISGAKKPPKPKGGRKGKGK